MYGGLDRYVVASIGKLRLHLECCSLSRNVVVSKDLYRCSKIILIDPISNGVQN